MMRLLALLLASVTVSAVGQSGHQTVVLHNGATIEVAGHSPYKYWNCADVTLSHERKDASLGGELVLEAGAEKRILIKFTDINRAIGPGKRIVGAKLILTLAGSVSPKQVDVYRVLQDWNEGYGRRKLKSASSSQWSATWDYRLSPSDLSGDKWAVGGCSKAGVDRAERPTAVGRAHERATVTYEVPGLEADVQEWYGRHYTNFGWLLECRDEEVQFASCQAATGRPGLEISYVDEPQKGNDADLGVTYIERVPEFQRYDPTNAYTYKPQRGSDVGIMNKPGLASRDKWPADGSMITYRGHVRNHGSTAAIPSFKYTWFINGHEVSSGEITKPLGSGEETVVEIPAIWVNYHKDHRTRTVTLRVDTEAPETTKSNNELTVPTQGLNIGIHVEKSFYDYMRSKPNGLGSYSFEDWVQWQFWLWNEVYFAKSKFSFAPDGCLERCRIQRIDIVPDGTLGGGNHVPGDKSNFYYDGEWGCAWSKDKPDEVMRYCDLVRTQCESGLLHELSHQIGLMDLYVMNIDASLPDGTRGKVRLKAGGDHVITRGCIDPFGGLMGGGDTRNDTILPLFQTVPNEPTVDFKLQYPLFEPTGLYAGVDVAGLNSCLGFRRGFYGEFLYDVSKMVFLRALDASGQPMPGAKLSFFQENGGEFKDEVPVFEGETNQEGLFRLPAQPIGQDADFRTLTGHTLQPNPFGRIDVVGSNGAFLIRVRYAGQEEWRYLKLWEANAAYYRGSRPMFVWETEFNLAPKPIAPENAAQGKAVTASDGSDVKNLTDGDIKTTASVPSGAGAWLTIDLGADMPVESVSLETYRKNGDFWHSFDILAYPSNGTPETAAVFAQEADWGWVVGMERDVDPADLGHWTVAYRNAPKTARYIRIVNRSAGGGELAGVIVQAQAR